MVKNLKPLSYFQQQIQIIIILNLGYSPKQLFRVDFDEIR